MGVRKRKGKATPGVTVAGIRKLALALPAVVEGASYGTPAYRVSGKLFLRLHQDGESLVVRALDEERDALLAYNPAVYYVTDHYRGHPWVLVRFGLVRQQELAGVIEQAWRLRAPAKLIADHDAEGLD